MPSRYETASSAKKLKEELDEVKILQQTKVVDFQTLYFDQEKDEKTILLVNTSTIQEKQL